MRETDKTTVVLGDRSIIQQGELRAALNAGGAVVLISGPTWYRMRLVRDRLVYETHGEDGSRVAYLDPPRSPSRPGATP